MNLHPTTTLTPTGTLDPIVVITGRHVGARTEDDSDAGHPVTWGVLMAFDGTSGEFLWRTRARNVLEGGLDTGLSVALDLNQDGQSAILAGTSLARVADSPGHLVILDGATGDYLAEVVYEYLRTFPEMCRFGERLSAFDEPTDRRGVGVAVSHRQADRQLLTAWSCRP